MILNLGIVGVGNFAQFASEAFLRTGKVKMVACMDVDIKAASKMARQFHAASYSVFDEFLCNENMELVYISTPPSSHYHQSKSALLAGKHVICEKPAALELEEAQELALLAEELGLLYSVNLMQRYNPLYDSVKKIIDGNFLGTFLHGFFENYASDEKLDANHWFWDASRSGGIFIEHGVHFFDMFYGWFGAGKVLNAVQLSRPGIHPVINDRVQASVLYAGGTVNFYHGFDQPGMLDRQEMRLLFSNGQITLYGWIPLRIEIHGLLTRKDLSAIKSLLGECHVKQIETEPGSSIVRGRFMDIGFDDHVVIDYTDALDKPERYQQMLMAMITDQVNWIFNRNDRRIIDHHNAIESLRTACEATNKLVQI
jgi:predicted dehydrogenase